MYAMNDESLITSLTVGELKELIRHMVQEAVAEVLIEFSIAAQYDADIGYQAEMTELIRTSFNDHLPMVDD